MRRLRSLLLLLMITLFKGQVFGMVFHTGPRFSRFFMKLFELDTSDITDSEVIRLIYLMSFILHDTLSHLMYPVGMFPVTMFVTSNTKTLLSPLVVPLQHVWLPSHHVWGWVEI